MNTYIWYAILRSRGDGTIEYRQLQQITAENILRAELETRNYGYLLSTLLSSLMDVELLGTTLLMSGR